ncbi:MAG: helix-turn-helix transcriptional regulator [Prevotella sp.]|nr:helix-turn-helix transcriptional regulator [Prevotella sp.]MBS5527914.1 helix-turn-helix transcriptional regulator [Prevotella sp.]
MNKDLNCIKVVLVQKKKTGKWLAGQLGLSESTVSRWCSNAAQPNLNTLNKVAKLLEVEMKDLLNESE